MEDVGRYFWYKLKIFIVYFFEVRYGYNFQMGYKFDLVY